MDENAVYGHRPGPYTAACYAGVRNLEEIEHAPEGLLAPQLSMASPLVDFVNGDTPTLNLDDAVVW